MNWGSSDKRTAVEGETLWDDKFSVPVFVSKGDDVQEIIIRLMDHPHLFRLLVPRVIRGCCIYCVTVKARDLRSTIDS